MNNCYQCEELISRYIEDELNYNDKRQFNKHLDNCSPCASKTKNVRALRNSLLSLPAAQTSSDFDSMLRARIHLEQRQEKRKRESLLFSWKVKGPILGLSSALAIFVLLTVFSQISNRNAYSPDAAVNQAWKNGQFAQQGSSNQEMIIYWIDRKPAVEIVTMQTSGHLKSLNSDDETRSDSSLFVENNQRPARSSNYYPTSF